MGGGRTWYVHHIEPVTHTVVVAEAEALGTTEFDLDEFWIRVAPDVEDLEVQVRYRHAPAAVAALEVTGANARVHLATPERAVAPGQAAVFYVGDAVVAGGRIIATRS